MRRPGALFSMSLLLSGVLLVASGCADSATAEAPTREPAGGGVAMNPGRLTAGEWRDLDHWDFWRGLLDEGDFASMDARWGYDTSRRYTIDVVDAEGQPAVDARALLLDEDAGTLWEARTDNTGRAELFAGIFGKGGDPALLIVESGGDRVLVESEGLEAGRAIQLQLDAVEPAAAVDLMFMVDTTGSMGDELNYLQVELRDVIERVQRRHEDLSLRVSVNFYRDIGDPYVVRSNAFTEDLDLVMAQLQRESAAGGGDYEEAVDQAMIDAIEGHDWRGSARARILFLLLDAPPHATPESLGALHRATALAAQRGVRLIPIGASGIDKDTEFLMRSMDVATGGTYIFLTDDSGVGGAHLRPSVGDFKVEPLNDMLVRLIDEAAR